MTERQKIVLGKTYTYFPKSANGCENIKYPATVVEVGSLIKVILKTPDGEQEKTVRENQLYDQPELF